ncbi:MAG: dipeptidase [Velocimicrobium sp.]
MNYFDCHVDTLTELFDVDGDLEKNNKNLDMQRVRSFAKQYGHIFAIWNDMEKISKGKVEEEFRQTYQRAKNRLNQTRNTINLCLTAKDMEEAFALGKEAAFLSIEDISFMGSYVEQIKELGFRFAMLTWNHTNQYASGSVSNQKGSLTYEGRELVKYLMNQGIILDISHLSDRGVEEVFEITEKPIMASHSNVRQICKMDRNLPNDYIKELIRRNGLIGMNFFRPFVGSTLDVTMDTLIQHMDYILNLGGENVLAIGSDFDGSDDLFPKGIKGVESIPALREEMKRAGFSEAILDKVFFENAHSFIKKNLI